MMLSMAIFSLSMSISPGPVNLLAMTSGLNYGFAKSIKFVAGATIGFTLLLFTIGYGLGSAHGYFPSIVGLLKYIGCGYLFYIGVKVYSDTGTVDELEASSYAPSFIQGWLMQWLNPKAWVACLAGCSAFNVYTSEQRLTQFVVIYFIICFFGIASWALLGEKIKAWISSAKRVQTFNRCMGLLLCGLAVVLLLS